MIFFVAGQLPSLLRFERPFAWCQVSFVIAAILVPIYVYDVFRYRRAHRSESCGQVPSKYPPFIPYLGVVIPLIWNPRNALARFTSYNGCATVTQLSVLPGLNVFLYQDPEIVRRIWKKSTLLDFRPMASYFFNNECGMPKQAASAHMADETEDQVKCLTGSNKPKKLRIHRNIYESDPEVLAGQGLIPTLQRYVAAFTTRTAHITSDDWMEMDDFWTFIQETVGASEIEAIFGANLLRMFPDFMSTFFEFDRLSPYLIKGMSFTRIQRVRHKLLFQFRCWFRHARKHFAESDIYKDGDGDPFWGSAWTRYRHRYFTHFFDDDALSSSDLAVAWGSLGHTVPCTLMTILNVLQDASLLSRVRREIDETCGSKPLSNIDPKQFSSHPLLSSIYAETLRLHVTVCIPVVPLHGELDLGKWRIPKASYGLINAGIAHMNKDVWNTKGGLHPVESFWAERFIINPADPLSGPIRPETQAVHDVKNLDAKEPYFTTEGLGGSWIPFGGGRNMCPGRFMAKGFITLTLAMLTRQFDIELGQSAIVLGNNRFGVGTEHPTCSIPFRIRKRKTSTSTTSVARL